MAKLLITTGLYPPEIGGPATYTKMLEEHLPKLGYEVSALPFSSVRHLPKFVRHVAYFFLCFKATLKHDVVFAQDTVSVGLPSLCAAKLARRKFIIRVPGDYAWEQSTQRYGVTDTIDSFQTKKYARRVELFRMIQRFVVRGAERVITPSDYFRELVTGWGISVDSAVTIYNGIDLSALPKLPETIPSEHVIVSAGRLVPWKGFEMLIRLLVDLPERWTLVIIGEGPERESLEARARELGVHGRVRFTGRLSREEVFGWYKVGTVFALNTSFESFSFQIVEALACGVPIVTTNIGSIPELVTDGVEGILKEPDDAAGFLAAIKSVLEDEERWSERVRKGKEKAQIFSIEETTKKLSEMLKKL